eukprot:3807647-Pleurochrysis_carterae.AAC.1
MPLSNIEYALFDLHFQMLDHTVLAHFQVQCVTVRHCGHASARCDVRREDAISTHLVLTSAVSHSQLTLISLSSQADLAFTLQSISSLSHSISPAPHTDLPYFAAITTLPLRTCGLLKVIFEL